ncbi:MAG TPA: amino acid adenylation domain-containing protein [Pyrinomonadaceae bacterium]|nr:amino acid adenylation domain-containing protein [Pyrinomonadaceae bacterium]
MSYESVQEMFSRVAAEFGPQTAIERSGRRVSYATLEAESNRLANFLLDAGVGKGTMVGLLSGDPIYVITGILGVLKAGAVFVPLDPSFPEGRLRVMSDQVAPRWFVSDKKQLEKLDQLLGEENREAKIVCLDGEEYLSYQKVDHPRVASDPDAPCSIYFTSGSTGRPKAILGRLKGIDHFMRWEIEAVGARPGIRVSQLASPCFDGFLKDIFVPLCSGGTACAPESREILADAPRLVKWIDDMQLEVLHCVPSVFRSLLNEKLDSNNFEALRYVVMAGEPLYPADVKRWIETFGERIKLVNIYGTTETSVAKVAYEVKAEDVERPTVPVGKPIKGSAIMLMDVAGKPCRQGTVGEIYIRTPYRSFGYYGDPELTNAVFVQNPFSQDPNDLVHKTGDYGRFLEDGNLEYLGRRDQQVQIRGVRIELGEIENLLRAHDAVADVAVVDRSDNEGNKFLVAYLTLTNGTGSNHLREYLAQKLPPAMLPSAFVEMDELPRTLNGKIDRKALPALELTQTKRDNGNETLNPIEEILAGIWCEVLRLPSVSRESSFFNIGGHSLLASQVIHRIQDIFKFELTVRSMFEAPTLGELAAVIQSKLNDGDTSSAAPIEPVTRDGKLPLSYAQQRLWFQEELARGTSTFHVDLGMILDGPVNWAALEQTFNEISRRHENLRTSFPVIDGEVLQIVQPFSRLTLPTVDLSRLNENEREAIDAQLANAALDQPFDLETGPLVRLEVIRHSDQKYSVLCVLHHIVSDGWSRGVLIREVTALYQAFGRGEPSPLPELKIQYGDYAVWQRERLQGDKLERELDFWKEELSGAPLLLDLPTDRPRPPVQTYRGAAESFALSPELSQQLKALSQQQGTTMFMLLLAAFQTLLHRYTNEDDIVVGTTIANRERSELEPLIGFFVNMLALRTDCSGNPSFLALLDQVRKTTLRAYAHQTAPFEELVRALRPKRNMGYLPLFQAVFSFHNQPTLTEMQLSGLTLSVPKREVTTSQIDLLLDMFESSDGLQGAVQYNADLFDRTTILQMMAHFENLLAAVAIDPEQRLLDLAMLSLTETEEIAVWNHTQTASLPETCVHELIAAQVKTTPDAIAASFRGSLLTYAELNRRANQVAHYLHEQGIKPGDLVGICLDHSLEELIALLGVLKAGAGYVALDPEHPPQRIEFALTDANVAKNVTQDKLASDWSNIAAQPDSDLQINVSPDSLAYVIYTSGSTGQPKGAGISHRSLVNYVSWAKDAYLRGENLAFALYSSLAFDLTVTSIYVPLITGNKVAIFRRDAKDALLEEIIADGQVGVCKLTPSHLTLIKDVDNRKSSIKRLIVGGEALGTELTRQVVESFGGDVEIFNEYGPTEATVGCMIYQFDPLNDTRANVPIGRPAANVNLYVLDKWLQPVPVNVTGELFIASPGLAQGYLGRPSLTAERFIPNPYSPGQRMYRTGDLCRRLPSGDLEYLGREDEQVKFHGYRIETNEIRYALKKHPQVRDSAIVVTEDKHGHKVMIAYYVSRLPLEAAQLREFLLEHLIADTIPNFFVHLSKLPLTLNGKINYDALPSLEEAKQKQQRTYTAPRTPQEVSLASIWSEVLTLERVGVEENFFDLGGHSLLAAQIIHRINQTFEIDLPMRVIFDQPTIAGLALSIEEALIEKLEAVS